LDELRGGEKVSSSRREEKVSSSRREEKVSSSRREEKVSSSRRCSSSSEYLGKLNRDGSCELAVGPTRSAAGWFS
jgi:hypothetical protein